MNFKKNDSGISLKFNKKAYRKCFKVIRKELKFSSKIQRFLGNQKKDQLKRSLKRIGEGRDDRKQIRKAVKPLIA